MKRLMLFTWFLVVLMPMDYVFAIPIPPYPSESYSDLDDLGRYYDGVNWAIYTEVASGYEDKTWKPNNCVTRAEILKMLVESEGMVLDDVLVEMPFSDVSVDDWYYDYVSYAYEEGIVSGYDDATFKPNRCVSRAEGIKIIVEGKIDDEFIKSYNTDTFFYGMNASEIAEGDWWRKYLRTLLKEDISIDFDYEIFDGELEVKFNPAKDMTRAEVAHLLYELREADFLFTDLIRYKFVGFDLMLPESLLAMSVEYVEFNDEGDFLIQVSDPKNKDRWIRLSSEDNSNMTEMSRYTMKDDFDDYGLWIVGCEYSVEELFYSYSTEITEEELIFAEIGYFPEVSSCLVHE